MYPSYSPLLNSYKRYPSMRFTYICQGERSVPQGCACLSSLFHLLVRRFVVLFVRSFVPSYARPFVCLYGPFFHLFLRSLSARWLVGWMVGWFFDWLVRSFVRSYARPFVCLIVCWSFGPFFRLFLRSLPACCLLVACLDGWLVGLLIGFFVRSFVCSFVRSSVCLLVD